MVGKTKKIELTIDQYLKGCHCFAIYFQAGGCTLVMTDSEEEESALIHPNGTNTLLANDLTIVRFIDSVDDRLIEVQIKSDVDGPIFYLMYPTGTFIHQ